MRLTLQIALTALLAAAVAGGWLWLDGWGDPTPAAAKKGGVSTTEVIVEPVELVEERATLRVIGTGEARRSAAIYPSVSGEVMEVQFGAEQRVGQGDVLLRLDDRHQQLAVQLAQVALNEAERNMERIRKLAPTGAVSQVSLDTARTELESAQLRLEQARADLRDRTVFAPFDGIVGISEVDRGDRVSSETQIATLDDRSTLLVDFEVPENRAGGLRPGDPVQVRPWTEPDRVVEGEIVALGSRIDPRTRSLRVRAAIPNPDDRLRPGTSFEVQLDFVGNSYPNVREVAVLWSRDGAYVWRVAEDRVEKVFVQMVQREQGRVLVDGPLQQGDLVVVEGVQGLRTGQTVKPTPVEAGTAAAAAGMAGRS